MKTNWSRCSALLVGMALGFLFIFFLAKATRPTPIPVEIPVVKPVLLSAEEALRESKIAEDIKVNKQVGELLDGSIEAIQDSVKVGCTSTSFDVTHFDNAAIKDVTLTLKREGYKTEIVISEWSGRQLLSIDWEAK